MAQAVLKNIPIPKTMRTAPPPRRKWPLDDMGVGDMFFVPGRDKNNLATYCSTAGKKLGRRFTTRLCYMHEVKGDYVPCEPDVRGATLGVGVWRIK